MTKGRPGVRILPAQFSRCRSARFGQSSMSWVIVFMILSLRPSMHDTTGPCTCKISARRRDGCSRIGASIPQQLKFLSQHYSYLSAEYLETWQSENVDSNNDKVTTPAPPPEKIPADIIENLVRMKQVNSGMFYLHQLYVAIFDMTVHQPETAKAAAELNPSFLWNSLKKDISKLDGPETIGLGCEWSHAEVNFPHFMGDYDAGYYAYLW